MKESKQPFVNLSMILRMVTGLVASAIPLQQAVADQVFFDDVIVVGSECAGQDCANGESFGFDTLRLKENNLRINFQDTSNSASFPSNDWRIQINDSSNGGGNYFGIEDSTAGRIPFRVDAGAPANALRVDSSGDVGISEDNPIVELHVTDGDSPTLRLEQDGSSGFTAQTWDVASNETNFFIRDATNGSTLPFRIKPSAPTNSLYIDTDGDIGLGTASPDAGLHIVDSAASLLLEESDSNTAPSAPIHISRSGETDMGFPYIAFENTTEEQIWEARLGGSTGNFFSLRNRAGGGVIIGTMGQLIVVDNATPPTTVFSVNGGTATFSGQVNAMAFNPTSSRALKDNFTDVDVQSILDVVAELPITRWNFKADGETVSHVGPVAEDFYQAFGLGRDDKHIATVDSDGIALAAIQALHQQQQVKDEQINNLTSKLQQKDQQLDALTDRLAKMEAKLNQIVTSVQ